MSHILFSILLHTMSINNDYSVLDLYIMDRNNNDSVFIEVSEEFDHLYYTALKLYYYADRGLIKNFELEISHAKKIFHNRKKESPYSLILAIEASMNNRTDSAELYLELGLKQLDNAPKYWIMYELAQLKWEIDEGYAIRLLSTAIEQNPNFYRAIILKGLLTYPTDQQAVYSQFLDIPEEYLDCDSYRILGEMCYNNLRIDDAKTYFSKSLALNSQCAFSNYLMGLLILNYSNEFDLAEQYLLKSIVVDTPTVGFANGLLNLGIVYYYKKNFLKAEEYYLKAISISPSIENYEPTIQFYLYTQQYEKARMLLSEFQRHCGSNIYIDGYTYILEYFIPNRTGEQEAVSFYNLMVDKYTESELTWMFDIIADLFGY